MLLLQAVEAVLLAVVQLLALRLGVDEYMQLQKQQYGVVVLLIHR